MADKEGLKATKDYGVGIPAANQTYYVKGCGNYDFGMKERLARMFNPKDGKALMLAFDHGYFLGPTAGIERVDLKIAPLIEDIDVIMGTRGAIRSCLTPESAGKKAIALRCSSGSSVLDDDLSDEVVSVNIEDAIRMDASCMAIQVFVGSPNECKSIENVSKTINAGIRYGMPTMGVVAVGKDMARDARYFRLATRMIAEFGAQIVKCYYCEGFDTVASCCPVPIVIAGGKKLPEKEALLMCYKGISEGAAGMDMGRNIFQSEDPSAMAKAVSGILHQGLNDVQAFKLFNDLKKK